MAKANINILGICRFSMLGRGDWKAYKDQRDENLEAIYEAKAKELFNADRMERRFQTFEHLTLRSINAQTEKDFRFLVVSSDRMPEQYRTRLAQLCGTSPNTILKFVSPMHVSIAIRSVLEELAWNHGDTLQFRLDDDDCISSNCLHAAKRHANAFSYQPSFAISFAQQYYYVNSGPASGLYNWFQPFLGAAVMTRHRSRSIYEFAHFKIQTKFLSIVDPNFPNIVTYHGVNDTPLPTEKRLDKRGMVPATREEIQKAYKTHFSFLSSEGLELSGLDRILNSE